MLNLKKIHSAISFRIEFDEKVGSKLSKTLPHLMKSLYEVPKMRKDELENDPSQMKWVVDSSPDSVANIALRKLDLDNFMLNNEGNLFNNLFFKVPHT